MWESHRAMLNEYGDVCGETCRWTMTTLFCVLSGLPSFPAAAPTETSNSSISPLIFEGIRLHLRVSFFVSAQRKAVTRRHSWNTQLHYLCMIHINWRGSNEATLRSCRSLDFKKQSFLVEPVLSVRVQLSLLTSANQNKSVISVLRWSPEIQDGPQQHGGTMEDSANTHTHTHTLS